MKALSFARPKEQRSLAMYFLYSLKENQLFEILENVIVEESNLEQVKEFAKLGMMVYTSTGFLHGPIIKRTLRLSKNDNKR